MTRTITALFADRATAERAVERLHAAGVPEACIEIHRADDGGLYPRDTASRGLFAAEELVAPDENAEATMRGRTTVVTTGVPAELAGEARRVLAEEALDVESDRDGTEAAEGAEGSLGGSGRATQEVDRLTGQPTGAAPAPVERDEEHGIGGGGSATGARDRLTGAPTTRRG
jgi:hypothetical protein